MCDIKVVTDLSGIGNNMVKYATILMPLTTGDISIDQETKNLVWQYCVNNGIRYTPRLHTELWGSSKRGV